MEFWEPLNMLVCHRGNGFALRSCGIEVLKFGLQQQPMGNTRMRAICALHPSIILHH